MIPKPLKDHGQQLTPPAGKVVGFFDDKAHYDEFAKAVLAADFPQSAIQSLQGDDGIQLLQRQKESSFFFGDAEDEMIQLAIKELGQGHLTSIVGVDDRKQALQIAQLAQQHEGRGFTHFGTWVNEQLPT